MKRRKTSLALIEAELEISDALDRLFAKERAALTAAAPDDDGTMPEAFTAESNNFNGILVGGCGDQEAMVKSLRDDGCTVPVIVLIERRCSQTSIQLLNAGADDVLVKPINAAEVLERMNAIVRRSFGHQKTELNIGEIKAYFDGRDPEVDGQRIKLSHREHTIFTHLALCVGRVVSKDTIYNAVYGMRDTQPFDKVVDVYICKLRKKLASYTSGGCYIETVYGRGYKLDAPECHTADVPDAEDIASEDEIAEPLNGTYGRGARR